MTDKEKYEVVNEFFTKCENIALDCDANQDCHKCVLQGSPINCDAEYFEISEHQFNQIMDYKQKTKSQQMLEELGFKLLKDSRVYFVRYHKDGSH